MLFPDGDWLESLECVSALSGRPAGVDGLLPHLPSGQAGPHRRSNLLGVRKLLPARGWDALMRTQFKPPGG